MQKLGNVKETEMFRAFNMGVGMVIVCSEKDIEKIKAHLEGLDEKCFEIGRVVEGNKEVSII